MISGGNLINKIRYFMKVEIHENEERWYFNQKWIKSYFSFSYADYHNHKRPGFWKLLVLNEDQINSKEWFPARPHKNMEIISIPLEWELHHKDSLGNNEKIKKWSVQTISAWSGISHSEVNDHIDDPLHVLHIWIESENHNGEPLYQQQKYFKKDRINTWQMLVSWDKKDNCNFIYQDAYISRIALLTKETITYQKRNKNNGVYFFVIEGDVIIWDNPLATNDAVAVNLDDKNILVNLKWKNADILAIEVPMQLKNRI
jgi:redox-sensitive bicupin YhaK (pirin superfamily)